MCCDHCHCEIAPGTERTVWDGVKRWVRVCALCLPFVASITFGQTSPTQEPAPIPRYIRSTSIDSSTGATEPTGWRREELSRDFVIVEEHQSTEPARPPHEDTPELPHPPHGEGSGELPIFVGIGASGAMTNVANTAMISPSWEPPDHNHSAMDRFFLETDPHAQHATLKVGSVHAQRPTPRARRSC